VGLGMSTSILCEFVCIIFKTEKSCGFGQNWKLTQKKGVGVDVGVGVVVLVWVFGTFSSFQVR
jgi:hypothetical protein